MPGSTSSWLQSAIQQMAAESYLDGEVQLVERLKLGNNNGTGADPNSPLLPGKIRFADQLTSYFVPLQGAPARYQIVHHHANDATGFSATLMKVTTTRQYTLSFCSSEYAADGEGGDCARDIFGADTEIKNNGFAFAQLVSMERYYRELQACVDNGVESRFYAGVWMGCAVREEAWRNVCSRSCGARRLGSGMTQWREALWPACVRG